MGQIPDWLDGLEHRKADQNAATKAVEQLYREFGESPPGEVVWAESPKAALVTCSQRAPSKDPRLFHKMMQRWDGWSRDGCAVFADPPWKILAVGRRLQSRSSLTAQALARECPEGLVRSFSFNPRVWQGDGTYDLDSPRCLNLDELAEKAYHAANGAYKRLPSWHAPLVELVRSAGWMWPLDDRVVLAATPISTGYDEQDRIHNSDGPAIVYADGWWVWAIHGEQMAPRAVVARESIGAADILAEPDEKKRRELIRLRGPVLLENGEPSVRRLARMVFEKQYHRFEAGPWRVPVQPWPENLPEPRPRSSVPSGTQLEDGLYFSVYPNGQLRLLAGIERRDVVVFLWLAEGRAEAWHQAGNMAQKYFPDGRLEDFSPWDDSSDPYWTPISFQKWVQDTIDGIFQAWLRSRG